MKLGDRVRVDWPKKKWDGARGRVAGVWPWKGPVERCEVVSDGRMFTVPVEYLVLDDFERNVARAMKKHAKTLAKLKDA